MKRYSYDLSNYHMTSCGFDYLYPIGLRECIPGDTIRQSSSVFVRLSPMVNPVMHPLHVTVHHWFVPYRLLCSFWKDWIADDDKASNYVGMSNISSSIGSKTGRRIPLPSFTLRVDSSVPDWFLTENSLIERLGFKYKNFNNSSDRPYSPATTVSLMPLMAYQLIWNEFYRDPDLDKKIPIMIDGYTWPIDPITLLADKSLKQLFDLRTVSTPKDYFTCARPYPQAGSEASVSIDTSEVKVNSESQLVGDANFKVRELRESVAVQRYLEHRLKQGYDYSRYLKSFGIRVHNDFCERPVYLGGNKDTIQFSDVVQTVGTNDAPLGSLAGYGIGVNSGRKFKYHVKEHGYIMSLCSFVPSNLYSTQNDPLWFKNRNRFDYFTKELEHIGMVPMYNRELGINSDSSNTPPSGVFGYKDIYEEYRTSFNQVSAGFRENGPYKNWTMSKSWNNTPVLNADFVASKTSNRIFADLSNPPFQVMVYNKVHAKRIVQPKPKYYII